MKDAPRGGKAPVGYQPRPLDEWLAYLAKVHAARGLRVIGEEEIARDPEGNVLLGGFFGVEKSNEGGVQHCRGIVDRRPKNSLEETLPTPVLPHGTMMCSLVLHSSEQLRMSCRDLENFFCSLRLPYAKICRTAVGTAISPNQLEEIGIEVPPT